MIRKGQNGLVRVHLWGLLLAATLAAPVIGFLWLRPYWVATHHGVGADLRRAFLFRAPLRGAQLAGAHLRRAILDGADLRDANLSQHFTITTGTDVSATGQTIVHEAYVTLHQAADLREASIRGADLRYARLTGVDLRGADLRGADLRHADLLAADLEDALLQGADLRGTELSAVRLRNAVYDSRTRWPAGFDPRRCGAICAEEYRRPTKPLSDVSTE